MSTKVTTDYHIGVKRIGGTTPASQHALCKYLRNVLDHQLDDSDQLIAGDLFNDFTVETSELLETYKVFSGWLLKYGRKLCLVRGNHDYSLRGLALSSFDLLGAILKQQFIDQVTIADTVTEWKEFVLVPHLPNNDLLNLEIAKLNTVTNKIVVFHANLGNVFAADSQHSLNVSLEQISNIVGRNNKVFFGHEHQHRYLCGGSCIVLGNVAPSSVSDCVNCPSKYAARVHDGHIHLEHTWASYDNYIEVDWKDLKVYDHYKFIRVTGEASAAEAADVIKAVSKLRQSHEAFVITNAVKIEGCDLSDELASSVEDIKVFDVVGAIMGELTEQEQNVVKGLLE
jgi:hypothetical protein